MYPGICFTWRGDVCGLLELSEVHGAVPDNVSRLLFATTSHTDIGAPIRLASGPRDPATGMEVSETCHLLLFTKYPRAGFAKTRMIPLLGPEGAAQLSKDMSEHIVRVMRSCARVMESKGARVVLRLLYAGDADPADITGWLGEVEGERVEPQAAGNLGARLTRAFEESFDQPVGPLKVVVIGSDIPGIDEPLLRESFGRLDDSDAVMGPSEDGGYYLLGLRRWAGDVFRDIPWSTDTTGQVQLQRIRECGLTVTELRPLADVDNPDDFAVWKQVSGKPASSYRPSDDSVPPT